MKTILASALILASFALPPALHAQTTLYWDTNGSTAGASSGTTAPGTWDNSTANWSTSSAGTSSTTAWVSGSFAGEVYGAPNTAYFSAGSNATDATTVTVSGRVGVTDITFAEGDITLTGGTLALPTARGTFTVYAGASATIGSDIISPAFHFVKEGDGTLTITGSLNSTSNTYVDGGTLDFSGADASYYGGNIYVAEDGDGNLSVTSGAHVSLDWAENQRIQIAGSSGRIGVMTVDGAGSLVDHVGNVFDVGFSGNGTLNVLNSGAVVADNAMRIAVNTGSVGTVLVSGSDSLLTTNNLLLVGGFGDGTLTIESGGTVTANSALYFGYYGGTGTLNLNSGGTLAIGGTNGIAIALASGGSHTFNFAGGTLQASGTALTSVLPVALSSGTTSIIDTNNLGVTLSGSISGDGGLNKIGAGTLTLSGTNTYTGDTTISAGILQIGDGGTSGSLVSDVVNNTSLVFNRSDATTYAGEISGTGSLTKIGAGTLTLSGANTFTGDTTISAGSIALANSNALQNSTLTTAGGLSFGEINTATLGGLSGSQDLVLENASSGVVALGVGNNDTSTSYSGDLSGSGSLIKVGSGTLSLSGTNTYSGGTTVSEGTLSGNTTSLQGNIANNAAVVFDQASNGTYAGNLSGTGTLNKTGAGSLTLSGTNTYAGGTTVSGGTLVVASDANLGATSGALAVTSGATLNTGGDFRTNRAVTVDGSGSSLANNGELIIGNSGTGSLALTNNATVSAYNLSIGYEAGGSGSLNIASGSTVTASNGTYVGSSGGTGSLALNTGGTLTTAGLSGSGTFNLAGGTLRSGAAFSSSLSATLSNASTVDTNGYATTLSGVLSGTGSLTKAGTGNLTLSGANTYEGGTTVDAGTLTLGTATAMGSSSGSLTLNGGSVDLGGFNPTTGNVIFNGGSFTNGSLDNTSAFEVQAGSLSNALGGSAALTKTGEGTFILSGTNTYSGGTTISGGTLQLGDGGTTGSVVDNILNNANLAFNRSDDLTFSAIVSGSGSFTQSGSGNLILSGPNTYSGGTIVNAGTLTLGTATALGSTAGDLTLNGGTVNLGGFNPTTGSLILNGGTFTNGSIENASAYEVRAGSLGIALGGSAALTKTGEGTFVLSGDNTYAGGTTISDGTLQLGDGGTTGSVVGNILNNANLAFNRSDDLTFSAIVSGSGSLTKTGANTLTLSGANTHSGGTVVNGGTLSVTNAGNLGSGDITASNGGDITAGSLEIVGTRTLTITGAGSTLSTPAGHLWLNRSGSGYTQTLNITDGGSVTVGSTFSLADVSGTGNLNVSGTGSSLSTGGNLYVGYAGTGNATVDNGGTISTSAVLSIASTGGSSGTFNLNDGGTLQVGGADGITIVGGGTFNANGGTIQVTGSDLTTTVPMTLGSGTTSTVDTNGLNATLSGILTGSGGLTKSGAGSLTLSAANTYSGDTTISGGTLTLAHSLALQNSTLTTGAGLSFGDLSAATFGSLSGSSDLALTNASSGNVGLTLQGSNSTTYSGVLSGGGNLIIDKFGGKLTLTGENTFTGPVFIHSSSSLQIGDGGTTGSLVSSYINNSGTLIFDHSDALAYDHTIQGGGALVKSGSGTLTLSGNNSYGNAVSQGTTINDGTLVMGSASALGWSGANVMLNGGSLDLGGFDPTIATVTFNGGSFTNGSLDNVSAFVAQSGSLSSALSGDAALTKTGAGTFTLTGTNAHTGGTTISAGSLEIGNGGSVAGNITNNANLAFNRTDTSNYGGIISGSGALTNSGSGNVTLSNNNTYTGTTTVNNGTLTFTGTNALSGATGVNGGATLAVSGADATLTGTNTLNIGDTSDGNLSISDGAHVSSYSHTIIGVGAGTTGVVTVDGDGSRLSAGSNFGILDVGSHGTGTLNVTNGGTASATWYTRIGVNASGTGTVNVTGANSQLTANDDVNIGVYGNGTLNIADGGVVTANTGLWFGALGGTGTLNLNPGGTLAINATDGFTTGGGGTAHFNGAGGTLKAITHNLSTALNITLVDATTTTVDTNSLSATLSGTLSGSGSLAKSGAGTLTLSGTNSYSGGTTVNAGTLTLGNVASLGATSGALTLNGGSLDLGGFNPTIGTVTFNGGSFTNGTLDNASAFELQSGSVTNELGGAAALTKTGSGTSTLSGTNTYSGGTTVSGGTLAISSDSNLGHSTGSLAITAGGSLSAPGNFITNRAITIDGAGSNLSNNGELIIGNSATSSLSLTNGATATAYNLGVGYNSGGDATITVASGSSLTVSSETTLGRYFGGNGNVTITGSDSVLRSNGAYYSGWLGAGTTTIASGGLLITPTLSIAANNGTTGTLNLNSGGTLETHGLTTGLGSATVNFAGGTLRSTAAFTSTVNATLANTSTVDTNGHATTLSGVLSGSGALSKTGTGTLTLSGSNSYEGDTTISAGSINLANASGSAFGTGDVTVQPGATLTGTGSFTGALILDAGATLNPGNSPGLMTIGSGSVLNGNLNFEIGGLTRGIEYDAINIDGDGNLTFGGTLNLSLINDFAPSSGDTFDLFNYTAATGTFDTVNLGSLSSGLAWDTSALYTTGTLSVITSAVPEPSTYAAILGACALGFVAWRKRRSHFLSTDQDRS